MSFAVWLEATRPRTLPAAAAPVAVGTALAAGRDGLHWPAAVAALVGALLIQIGTNYANDYFDFVKGADTDARVGPRRATQAGLVSPRAMRLAFVLAFVAASAVGAYLMVRGGWPIVAIGVASVASGILYTGGPYPLGYNGLGDLFVWIFFGPVAVGGTVYVQTLDWRAEDLVVGGAFGFVSTAILVVNNLRDVATDAPVGKRTLAVRFGKTAARFQYGACLGLAICLPLLYASDRPWLLALLALTPFGFWLTQQVAARDGAALNPMLGATGKFLLGFALVFCCGWLL
ncbi:MAG: 1,4-dihydroxy-2-naphthoate polyprenyltransferase [bacterium]|nr:1,4-dihydroxy-2-naphthoate polyprenyltransferase [bacterium]